MFRHVITVIDAVVAPVDQRKVPLPVAVNVVDGVVQFNARPLLFEMDAPGKVLSNVVVALAVDVHPFSPVTVTVNVPAVFTVIEAVVAPVDQRKVPLPVAVNVVDGVVQFNARPLSL